MFYIIDPNVAKVGIGLAVTLIAAFKIYQNIVSPLVLKKVKSGDEVDTLPKKVFRYSCLIIGGVVHGAFNIGGPLITVYTLEAVKDKIRFRNTMIALWATLDILNSINQFRNGAWTPYLWSAVLVCVPFAAVGFILALSSWIKLIENSFCVSYMLFF